jgi:hypothetical protein
MDIPTTAAITFPRATNTVTGAADAEEVPDVA